MTGPEAFELAAIILDFDGLILDTETPIFESWQEAFRERGVELELKAWQHALGTHRGFDPCAHLASLLGAPQDCEALRRRVRERNLERCERQPILPGVVELVNQARSLGVRTAVASSSSCGWVEGWLERHSIRRLFDCVRARDDVERVKPAPDLFLAAAAALDVAPPMCIVFEDSPNGIRAARAAGMHCVAIPNAVTRPLSLPDPDLVLASAAELPFDEIVRRLRLRLPERRDRSLSA